MPDKALIEKLADAFVAWPLPDSVCSDQCATMRDYKHRSGTNLLTVLEARQMFEYCLSKVQALDAKDAEISRLGKQLSKERLQWSITEQELGQDILMMRRERATAQAERDEAQAQLMRLGDIVG